MSNTADQRQYFSGLIFRSRWYQMQRQEEDNFTAILIVFTRDLGGSWHYLVVDGKDGGWYEISGGTNFFYNKIVLYKTSEAHEFWSSKFKAASENQDWPCSFSNTGSTQCLALTGYGQILNRSFLAFVGHFPQILEISLYPCVSGSVVSDSLQPHGL